MNPEDFSQTIPECENEKPFRVGGHWDETMWEMKKPSPVQEDWEG